jgi:hypothetical protein
MILKIRATSQEHDGTQTVASWAFIYRFPLQSIAYFWGFQGFYKSLTASMGVDLAIRLHG